MPRTPRKSALDPPVPPTRGSDPRATGARQRSSGASLLVCPRRDGAAPVGGLRSRPSRGYERASACPDPRVHVNRVNVPGGPSPPAGSVPDEEDGCVGGRRDRESSRSDPLGAPAIRQADHEHACAGRGLNDALSPGGIRTGSVTMPTTCCTSSEARASSLLASRLPECRVCLGAEQAEAGVERRREPSGELDRGPVVFGASERGDDRAVGRACSGREEADLAGRLLEEVGERLAERGLGRAAPAVPPPGRGRRAAPPRAGPPRLQARRWCTP